jgi:hypothetical protein
MEPHKQQLAQWAMMIYHSVVPNVPSWELGDYCALAEALYPLLPIKYVWMPSTTNVSCVEDGSPERHATLGPQDLFFGESKNALVADKREEWGDHAKLIGRVAMTVEMIAITRRCRRVAGTLHFKYYNRFEGTCSGWKTDMLRICSVPYIDAWGLDMLHDYFPNSLTYLCPNTAAPDKSVSIYERYPNASKRYWVLKHVHLHEYMYTKYDLICAINCSDSRLVRYATIDFPCDFIKFDERDRKWIEEHTPHDSKQSSSHLGKSSAWLYRAAVFNRQRPCTLYSATMQAFRCLYDDPTFVREDIVDSLCKALIGWRTIDVVMIVLATLGHNESLSSFAESAGNAYRYIIDNYCVNPIAYEENIEHYKKLAVHVFLSKANIHDKYGNVDPGFEAGAYLVEKAGVDQKWLLRYTRKQIGKGDLKGHRLAGVRRVCPALDDFLNKKYQPPIDTIFKILPAWPHKRPGYALKENQKPPKKKYKQIVLKN